MKLLFLHTASAHPVEPVAVCMARVLIQDDLYIVKFIAFFHTLMTSCWRACLLRPNGIIDCAWAEVE